MDVPPSRYRVVERGRRLIVIDTKSGMPVSGIDRDQQAKIARLAAALHDTEPRDQISDPAPANEPAYHPPYEPASRPPPSLSPAPIGAGDANILTTQPWFDDRAPRRIRIRENGQGAAAVAAIVALFASGLAFVTFGWPALVIGFVLLLNLRKTMRAGITRWLDGMEQV
jgi:hypothetical protein